MAPPAPNPEQRNELKKGLERKRWNDGTRWLTHLGDDLKPIVHEELKQLHRTVLSEIGITEENYCTDCTVQNALRCPTSGKCNTKHGVCSFHKRDPQSTVKCCPKGFCHRVQGEVEKLMTKKEKSLHWRNVDFAKLCREDGWWELVKAALKDGFATDDPDSVDISGLLTIIMNVKSFDDVFDGKVSSQDSPFEQVREIRNRLMHSSSKTCSEEDYKPFTNAIRDIVPISESMFPPIRPQFFTKAADKKSATCNLCSTTLQLHGGTSNLNNYLKSLSVAWPDLSLRWELLEQYAKYKDSDIDTPCNFRSHAIIETKLEPMKSQAVLGTWFRAQQEGKKETDMTNNELFMKRYDILYGISLRNAKQGESLRELIKAQLITNPSHHKLVDELFEFAPEDHLILLEGVDEYWEMLRKHRGKSCRMDTGQILLELDVPDRCHVMLANT